MELINEDKLLLAAYREVQSLRKVWDIDDFSVGDVATVVHDDGFANKEELALCMYLESHYRRGDSPKRIIKDAVANGLIAQLNTVPNVPIFSDVDHQFAVGQTICNPLASVYDPEQPTRLVILSLVKVGELKWVDGVNTGIVEHFNAECRAATTQEIAMFEHQQKADDKDLAAMLDD